MLLRNGVIKWKKEKRKTLKIKMKHGPFQPKRPINSGRSFPVDGSDRELMIYNHQTSPHQPKP
jgi:hypothetical protein